MGRGDIIYVHILLVKASFTGPHLTMVKCNPTMYLECAEIEIFGEKDYLPRICMYVQEQNRWVIVYACTSSDQGVANSSSQMAAPFCFTGLPSHIAYYF